MSQKDLAGISDSDGGQKQADKTTPICPACGSKLTRRSMRRSWKDRFKSAFGLWPYRCQMCNMRFTGPQDPEAIVGHNATVEEDLRKREADARALAEEQEEADRTRPEDLLNRPDRK